MYDRNNNNMRLKRKAGPSQSLQYQGGCGSPWVPSWRQSLLILTNRAMGLFDIITTRLYYRSRLPTSIDYRGRLRNFASWKRGIRPRSQAPKVVDRRTTQSCAHRYCRNAPANSTSSTLSEPPCSNVTTVQVVYPSYTRLPGAECFGRS